jgi:hypothetical protein
VNLLQEDALFLVLLRLASTEEQHTPETHVHP